MIMKLFIALIGLVAFVCCEPSEEIQKKMEENRHNLGNYEKQCGEELGLSQEEIKEVLKLSDDSQKAKCFFRCYIQKQGFFDEFDEPNEELIYYSSQGPKNHELITHIVLKCTDLEAEDPCQRAYDMVECFALQSENVQRYMHHQMNEAQAAGDDDDRDEL